MVVVPLAAGGRRWTVTRATVAAPVPSVTGEAITENVGGPSLSKMVPVAEIFAAPPGKAAFWGLESSTANVSVFSSFVSPAMVIVIGADRAPGAIGNVT